MRSCFVLLFASLLTSCEAQGTIETPGFVLKGRDLLLKLHDDPPEGVLFVDWKMNKTVTLVRFDPSGKSNVRFTGRFELGGKNSVILKNLQEVDSGVYSAVAVTSTSTGDKLVSEYKVTVQGPVSPVELTVDPVDSSSSESCDLHVTCRTHNSHISSTFKCPKGVCSQEGGKRSEVTTSGASLQVYLFNTVIICNHSNQVHWTQDLIHAESLCSSKPDPPLHYGWMIATCILLVILTVIMIVVLFFWLHHQRRIIQVGRRFEDLVHEALLDKNVTNILEEPHPESQSLGTTTTQPNVQPLLSSDQHETHQSNTKRSASASDQNWSPADASDLGRRFEKIVNEVYLRSTPPSPQNLSPADPDPGPRQKDDVTTKGAPPDKKGTNSSEEAGAESKSHDTTTQTNVQPPPSSDQHETHQSNIKKKTPASHPKLCPPVYTSGYVGTSKTYIVNYAQAELEPLNETIISSSFVKSDAGSIQPESDFGREDSL